MAVKNLKLAADFETTTDPADVRVWASCAVDIDTAQTAFIGNDIDSFFDYLKTKNTTVYFHNLAFDGEFILNYLLTHGYTRSEKAKPGCFDTLITDTGVFYSITVWFEQRNKKWLKATFYDSYKKLPFSVAVIAKAFELEDQKLTIDYEAPRPRGHVLTPEEEAYIVADCRIVAQALRIQFEEGLKKMTNASDALNGFKDIINRNRFEQWFPVLPVAMDLDIRQAYKGGFVYLNPKFKGARGLRGITLDVNSLYPSVMYDRLLPYGYPMYYEGEYVQDDRFPLYIQHFKCTFELKPGHLPMIQLKHTRGFVDTEYLTSSGPDPVELHLTSVDLQLFMDHYDVYNLEWLNGWKFKGARGIFKDYIDYWGHIKTISTGARRQLAKLMLNSLYGKFATNPKSLQKLPYVDERGVTRYTVPAKKGPYVDVKGRILDELPKDRDLYLDRQRRVVYDLPKAGDRDPVYTAMGCFITAYAREKTIRSGQAVYDRFIYADTDSLHLIGEELPEGLEIHPSNLGAWKHEGTFTDSKFLHAKTYMETYGDTTKVTCAGMPDNIKAEVTYDNFVSGHTFYGKLIPHHYPGGIVLQPGPFTVPG